MKAIPWFVSGAVEFMESNIKATDHVFEWGSGGSTLWLAERVELVISVEHDEVWYEKMEAIVPDNVALLYVPPDNEIVDEYLSKSWNADGRSFRDYATTIDDFSPFDWVLVDGRARVKCIEHAVDKFDRFLLLDNSERDEYHEAFSFMLPTESYTFRGDLATGHDGKNNETRIWVK